MNTNSMFILDITCKIRVYFSILIARILIPLRTLECGKSLLVIVQSVEVNTVSVFPGA
jgi:hypothetical protein